MQSSMIDPTEARLQESMRTHPGTRRMAEFPYPLRGVIDKVYYHDEPDNPTGQTVVDVNLHGGYNKLLQVPLGTTKVNRENGYEWTPDEGDCVIVQFIGGNWTDPIITGYFPLQDNRVQAKREQAPAGQRRYHRKCNNTTLIIDKDGNQIESVAKDKTVTIEGHKSLTVKTGNIDIKVLEGKCTVYVKGKTVWKSDGTIEHDGGSGNVKGVVQGDCICPYTRKPHAMISSNVKASI